MLRKIIKIDEDKCNGCGLCAKACLEGAIGIIDGKAKLLRDDYCDGLGNCLPVCPTDAISFEEREAAEFDEEAVKKHMETQNSSSCNCPGTAARTIEKEPETLACGCPGTHAKAIERKDESSRKSEVLAEPKSQLNQWPAQIKLVSPNAAYFKNAQLLIAADCTAFAYGNLHNKFMKNKITLIGCPKLDDTDYSDKLAAILANNDIKSITVLRMKVPCCGGIVHFTTEALKKSGKMIPWQIVTISTDGKIIED